MPCFRIIYPEHGNVNRISGRQGLGIKRRQADDARLHHRALLVKYPVLLDEEFLNRSRIKRVLNNRIPQNIGTDQVRDLAGIVSARAEESHVGKECVSTVKSRWT